MYFTAASDWFAALDYTGSRHSALYYLFIAYYRVPYAASSFACAERISHRYFGGFFSRALRDLLQPFTQRAAFLWQSLPAEKVGDPLNFSVSAGDRTLMRVSAQPTGNFPGIVTIDNSGVQCKIFAA